jgi:hypothetical protein
MTGTERGLSHITPDNRSRAEILREVIKNIKAEAERRRLAKAKEEEVKEEKGEEKP